MHAACHYKVWYMESCVERVQVVHLLLARGASDDCEIARHLSRKCAPSAANDRPVTPEDAAFRALLDGKDRSRAALEKAIANDVSH